MVHALDLHNGLVGRGLEHPVVATGPRVFGIYRSAQRPCPEISSLVHVGGIAVDQQGTETGMVHIGSLLVSSITPCSPRHSPTQGYPRTRPLPCRQTPAGSRPRSRTRRAAVQRTRGAPDRTTRPARTRC